jgi:hypothetical protein
MTTSKASRIEQPETDETEKPKSAKRFSAEALRQDPKEELIGVKKVTTTVALRKPGKQEFFQTHRDPGFWLDTAILELTESREIFMVDPGLRAELGQEIKRVTLCTTMGRSGALFLWPIPLPDGTGKRNSWHESARQGAELARGTWVRVQANMAAGFYDVSLASASLSDPQWPAMSFDEILERAFKDAYIDSMDHPALRVLRGEL